MIYVYENLLLCYFVYSIVYHSSKDGRAKLLFRSDICGFVSCKSAFTLAFIATELTKNILIMKKYVVSRLTLIAVMINFVTAVVPSHVQTL
jgi:hypothetical protein